MRSGGGDASTLDCCATIGRRDLYRSMLYCSPLDSPMRLRRSESPGTQSHISRGVMPESKTSYAGGCHCGAVRYTVSLDAKPRVIACNCSICAKKGWLMTFVPESEFTLVAGQNAVSDYQFNKKNIHHLFCMT